MDGDLGELGFLAFNLQMSCRCEAEGQMKAACLLRLLPLNLSIYGLYLSHQPVAVLHVVVHTSMATSMSAYVFLVKTSMLTALICLV